MKTSQKADKISNIMVFYQQGSKVISKGAILLLLEKMGKNQPILMQ